ncbi:selenium-dependent molybdenum cofactor biosynthesis protein YqeB [Clostridium grantii]|uniref:Xanthine dehydrogenase accessory factor n=1 Tax=Clostridium grantii DSM 8605 TaxID=1121316 RepID=A0A1M5WFP3_9CLOT|nr:selenium-dependent molybdenum cofactor biosynthesis protein YqeB [Clostridium grantii]SHH86379.1 xanthine dehydrogenase accessory factor [Clostridium grantii DSM 8605]
MFKNFTIVVRGGGDIATGIIHRLYRAGFKVIVLEVEKPSLIRRRVSFGQSIYDKEIEIEGIKSKHVETFSEAIECLEQGIIPVIIDEQGEIIKNNKIDVVVDAILAKKNLGTTMEMASVIIGVGPGFTVGKDVHAIIESNRGHNLGKVILEKNKSAESNTGIPGNIMGFTEERVVRAVGEGNIKIVKDIGALVKKRDVLATIEGKKVEAKIDGVVRGMINEGFYVFDGMKIGDIDPRGNKENCFEISDKARSVGGGVLEAVCYLLNK